MKKSTILISLAFVILALIGLCLIFCIYVFEIDANSETLILLLFCDIAVMNRLFYFNNKDKIIISIMRYISEVLLLVSMYLFFLTSANNFNIIQILMVPSMIIHVYGSYLTLFWNKSRNKSIT